MSDIPQVSVVILAKNEEEMIVNCIESLRWANEVVVIDDHSVDATAGLAKQAGVKVVKAKGTTFADKRNEGLAATTGEWILYIDADERVTFQLYTALMDAMKRKEALVYALKRNNVHYGKWLQHGGWEKDWVVRLFHRSALKKWTGQVHESAEVTTEQGQITEPLVHLTHRNMVDGLVKTIEWTGIEAELMHKAGHPAVTARTLLRKFFMEFFRRAWLYRGRKDGVEGWIEALTQAMNRFIVYERLWELQRKPRLDETYHKIDEMIMKQWQSAEYVRPSGESSEN